MFGLAIRISARIHGLLGAYAPSNLMLDLLRTRRGLKWAIPAALVLVPVYAACARLTIGLVEYGGPGWLNLLAALLCWNAIKFIAMIPVSLMLLVRAWAREYARRRAAQHEGYKPGRELGPVTTWSS